MSEITKASLSMITYYARKTGAVNDRSFAVNDRLPFDEELMDLEASGLPYAEIARRLGLTRSTVRCRLITLTRRQAVVEQNGRVALVERIAAFAR